MDQLISICDIEKYYGQKNHLVKAINRVSFEIKKGEFLGIMGASGSGKTTLLNLLSTIDCVTAGHIFYDNVDITEMEEDDLANFRKTNLGFIFQDFNLLDTLTIEENIILAMALQKKEKQDIDKTVHTLVQRLGITDILDKFPYEVSGGQKQRCACARALANNPKLILADEPTGALDSKSSRVLLQTFATMNESFHSTILMVTHDAFSASYCKRILFLKDGQLFNELNRGERSKKVFLNDILDVLSLTGGDLADD